MFPTCMGFDLHSKITGFSSLFDSSTRTLEYTLKGFGGGIRTMAFVSASTLAPATLGDNSVVMKSKGLVESIQHYGQCFVGIEG